MFESIEKIASDKIGHGYGMSVFYEFRPLCKKDRAERQDANRDIVKTSKSTHFHCNTTIHSKPEAGYSLVMMMTKTSFIRATN